MDVQLGYIIAFVLLFLFAARLDDRSKIVEEKLSEIESLLQDVLSDTSDINHRINPPPTIDDEIAKYSN